MLSWKVAKEFKADEVILKKASSSWITLRTEDRLGGISGRQPDGSYEEGR